MIRVRQTVRGEYGNCFGSCVASIFEVSVSEMPDYLAGDPNNPDWLNVWRDWLAERGLGVLHRPYCCDECQKPPGYSILSVTCQHNDGTTHAVVCLDGVVVHDPLPGKLCPDTQFVDWYIFVALDPTLLSFKGSNNKGR
jgi:hypothetical protein